MRQSEIDKHVERQTKPKQNRKKNPDGWIGENCPLLTTHKT